MDKKTKNKEIPLVIPKRIADGYKLFDVRTNREIARLYISEYSSELINIELCNDVVSAYSKYMKSIGY